MDINKGDVYAVGIDKYLVVHDLGEVLHVLNILRDTTNKVNLMEIKTVQGQLLKVNPYMLVRVKRELLTRGDKLANVDSATLESISESFRNTIS